METREANKSGSEPGCGQEKENYFNDLKSSFDRMNDHLVNELAGLQNQLNKRTVDWQDQLKNLSKAGDMLYGSLNKQLEFQSKLDGIMQESQKRQADMYQYYQEKLGTFVPKDKETKKKTVHDERTVKNETKKPESSNRSLLDRMK
jgi:hypothetical protein